MKRLTKEYVSAIVGNYPFDFFLVDKAEINDLDGITLHNERAIKIRDDLDDIATEIVLRHEVVHALLGTQGRVFQKKYNLEEVCEFIAYRLPEIEDIVQFVMKSWKGQ